LSVETAVESTLAHLPGLDENDRGYLARMAQALPLLADVARGDVLVYVRAEQPDRAIVCAEAKPHTVPAIYAERMVGRVVDAADEPAVIRAIMRGQPAQRVSRVLVRGHPTVQDVYPIWTAGKLIGALSLEIGLLEAERQKRKSDVFRRAVRQLRRMVLRGQLEGATSITGLGEHDGPLVFDDKGQIVYISSIAENFYRKLGYTHSLLGSNAATLKSDEAVYFKAHETGACVEQTVQEGDLTWVKKAIPLTGQPSGGFMTRLRGGNDEFTGVIIIIHDITDESRKEQELKIKSAMIKEIHHRVKNNLQTIAALLRLQARRSRSEEVAGILQETTNRILSISVVHDFLAREDEANNVSIREIAQRIVTEVTRGVLDPEKRLSFAVEGEDIWLPTQQATSCALIINELLQNAVEHGFATQAEGRVTVRIGETADQHLVEVIDNGAGLGADFNPGALPSLGLQIVQTLVREDLKGRIELQNVDGSGVRAVVTFPKQQRPATAAPLRS
jgi:two-component sensor histidine kinase